MICSSTRRQADRPAELRKRSRLCQRCPESSWSNSCAASDILIIDTQYTDEEYAKKIGWGHGSISSVVSLAIDAEVRKLLLFHHDPTHDDRKVDEMVEAARMLVLESGKPIEVEAAREGAEIWLGTSAAVSV